MKKKHFYAAVILLSLMIAGIQPALADTWVLPPPEGVTYPFGTWDPEASTFTLTKNPSVGDSIKIEQNELTLDGNSMVVSGSGQAGILLEGRTGGVTVKNVTVSGFVEGISLRLSNNCIVTNNTVSTCDYGIWLAGSNNNWVTGNTTESSSKAGIWLQEGFESPLWVGSDNNTLENNTASGSQNGFGIYIQTCSENTLTGNTISNNKFGIKLCSCNNIFIGSQTTTNNITNNHWGIHLYISNNNALTSNNISDNDGGIWIEASSENTLTDNTFSSNGGGIYIRSQSDYNILTDNTVSNNNYGIKLTDYNTIYPSYNKIYHNNFIDNTEAQAYVYGGTGNEFFKTDNPNNGGNYWSDWTSPDDDPPPDGDGFVDDPYVFTGGQDNLPWTVPDGWLVDTTPPEITCPGDTTVEAMHPDGVPVDDERIQTFLAGASADDNCDPEPTITNDAPAVFPPGDTIVTFMATDASDNTSTCSSTVTVVQAAESHLRIIPRIINREGRLQRILAVIRFPEGTIEEDIDIGQQLILYPGDSLEGVEAINQRIVSWYRWGTLRVSIFASFSKDEVTAGVPEDGLVELMVIGRFKDGQYFYGFDNVRIISWNWRRW